MATETKAFKTATLDGCARCGGNHGFMDWTPFTRPIIDSDGKAWTHWSMCPAIGEPILMTITAEEKLPEVLQAT